MVLCLIVLILITCVGYVWLLFAFKKTLVGSEDFARNAQVLRNPGSRVAGDQQRRNTGTRYLIDFFLFTTLSMSVSQCTDKPE